MINYLCDLCKSECNNQVFTLPIAATFVGPYPSDVIPMNLNLCKQCRSDIYRAVCKLAPIERIKSLNKQALDIQMNRT